MADAPADLSESFHFSVKEVPIDEERLMGLCFERPKRLMDSDTKWPSGNWNLHRGAAPSGYRTPYDWEEAEWGLPGQREREPDSHLDELVDGTLEELYYGCGYDVNAILQFLARYVQRVIEIEVYTPKEVLSEVVDGILAIRDATTAASEPERETAMDP